MDAPDAGASPLQHLQHGEFQRELAHAISELPERERLVLSMYYERELNLREIGAVRSEEHTSELQSLMRISYAVFCLKKKKNSKKILITRKQQDKQACNNINTQPLSTENNISRTK